MCCLSCSRVRTCCGCSKRIRRTWKGWRASFCRIPDLRTSPTSRSTSNTPNLMIRDRARTDSTYSPRQSRECTTDCADGLQFVGEPTGVSNRHINDLQSNQQTTGVVLDRMSPNCQSASTKREDAFHAAKGGENQMNRSPGNGIQVGRCFRMKVRRRT